MPIQQKSIDRFICEYRIYRPPAYCYHYSRIAKYLLQRTDWARCAGVQDGLPPGALGGPCRPSVVSLRAVKYWLERIRSVSPTEVSWLLLVTSAQEESCPQPRPH